MTSNVEVAMNPWELQALNVSTPQPPDLFIDFAVVQVLPSGGN